MHAGNVDDVFAVDKAVAGIRQHRCRVHIPARKLGHNRRRCNLAVVVGHVAAFRHRRGHLNGVAQHMHIFGGSRFKG